MERLYTMDNVWDNVSMSEVDTSTSAILHHFNLNVPAISTQSSTFANAANNTITRMFFNVWRTFLC